MRLNSLYIVLVCLTVCFFSACKDDDITTPNRLGNSEGDCDIMINDFLLNSENTELRSYNDYSNVKFINKLGQETTFEISDASKTIEEGIFEDSDTTTYCYSTEIIETTISNENGLQFTIVVECKPYFADIAAAQTADVLKIFYNDTNDPSTKRRLVFRKVLDIKDYPSPLYQTTEVIDSKYFIDKEFFNIEMTNFNTPIVTLYYSDEHGIVGFIDENQLLWQFDSKS